MTSHEPYITAMTAWDEAKNKLDEVELTIRQHKRVMETFYDNTLLKLKDEKITIPVREAMIRVDGQYQNFLTDLSVLENQCLDLKKEEREKRRLYEEAKSIYLNDLRMDKSSNYTPDTRPTTYQRPI